MADDAHAERPGVLDGARNEHEVFRSPDGSAERDTPLVASARPRCSRAGRLERLGEQDGALANFREKGGLSTPGGPPFFVSTNRNLKHNDYGI